MPSRATDNAAMLDRADTIVSRFLDRAARDPERAAYSVFPMGARFSLETVTWGEWASRSRAVAGALLALRVQKQQRVVIYADNREVWPVATLGAAMVGAITVGIAPDASASELLAQLGDCDPSVVVVDTIARLDQLRAAQVTLQRPFSIVCDDLEPRRANAREGLFEWQSWLKTGGQALAQDEVLRDELTARVAAVSPHDVLNIAFKPGTAIGVMFSHASSMAMAMALTDRLQLTIRDRVVVAPSFSQPFACVVGMYSALFTGATAALVEHASDALTASRVFQATLLCGSASLLQDLRPALESTQISAIHLRANLPDLLGESCRMVLIASDAPMNHAALNVSRAEIEVAAMYGTPEHPCVALNGPANWTHDALGHPFAQTETRIGRFDELQVRRNAMSSVGYFRREETFRQQLSEDGDWLYTRHRVAHMPSGALHYVGPVSDIIELPEGAAAHSLTVEAALSALPLVAHAVCKGSRDRPLVAVLSLRRTEVEAWALRHGVVAPWEALVEHPVIYEELSRGVATINASLDGLQRVAQFAATDLAFSAATGELETTGELNRPVLHSRFEHVFEDLHARARG